ncbi:hypothetical protein HY214_04360 [Candidatus Roizmanbacteria bacterium]|nr:hypothetical protein [Candidatus Roizmanbacteria bacterium]
MNSQKPTNPEGKRFLSVFLADRKINEEIYKLIPEHKFDYRMVNTASKQSDSPRESLTHQIYVTRNYVRALKTGTLHWGDAVYHKLMQPGDKKRSKEELLKAFDKGTEELCQALSDPTIGEKQVYVTWSKQPVSALLSIWSLDRHEILHQGWNLALMDHLHIPRFRKLKEMWGSENLGN